MLLCHMPTPVAPSPLPAAIVAPADTQSHLPHDAARDVAAVLAPHRRSPPRGSSPPMRVTTSDTDHILRVDLPGFAPDMVTISARRGATLAVVADMWHAEQNCHHEWAVQFPTHDVDMSSIRAQFSASGTLTITVTRLAYRAGWL